MSIARFACALLGLVLGLLFYIGFRSDYTLGNRLVSQVCGISNYLEFKQALRHLLPVPVSLRGCLPSALWCFIATSISGGWKMRFRGESVIPLAGTWPVINGGWETIQWLGWTDGRADRCDVVAGFVGWIIAQIIFFHSARPVEIPALWNWRVGVTLAAYACMGLADVWK